MAAWLEIDTILKHRRQGDGDEFLVKSKKQRTDGLGEAKSYHPGRTTGFSP
jgi:hypothetical protein